MPWLTRVLPAITVLLLAVAGILPWGHGYDLRFLLPALPFMAIHYWQQEHRGLVPAPFVALIGLAIDVLTSGPLGYWSLVFLIGLALTRFMTRHVPEADALLNWVGFAVAAIGMALAAWMVASAYVVRVVDWRPIVIAAIAQIALYPLVVLLLRPLSRIVAGPRILVLERQR